MSIVLRCSEMESDDSPSRVTAYSGRFAPRTHDPRVRAGLRALTRL